MKTWLKYFICEDDRCAEEPGWFGWAAALVFIVVMGLHVWRLDARYYFPHETGFQELIAKRHLDPGLSVTKALSSLNNLGAQPTYHLTHPPGLQLTLALLYWIFGISEQTARLLPLISFALAFIGMGCLIRKRLSAMVQLTVLTAFALAPLSFYSGHVVNFEPTVLACVIWTAVLVESSQLSFGRGRRLALTLLVIYGTLIDWPYTIFTTVLFALCRFRMDREPAYRTRVTRFWLLSVFVCLLYASIVYASGLLEALVHHAKVHSGLDRAEGLRLPLFASWVWWWTLLKRLWLNGSPVLIGTTLAALAMCPFSKRWRTGLHHWFLVFGAFVFTYFLTFSHATYNPTHYWSLFLFAPFLCLSFGLAAEHLRTAVQWILLAAFVGLSLPVSYSKLARYPQVPSVQFGRSIGSATQALPRDRRTALEGPLLYSSNVDVIPYYTDYETAFFSRAVTVAGKDRFLLKHQPEFVTIRGDLPSLFSPDRKSEMRAMESILQKSYSISHEQYSVRLWESLQSPHLSLMGFMVDKAGKPLKRFLLEDTDDAHVCAAAPPGEPALRINLRRIPKPGRRWLHGWVIAQGTKSNEQVTVTVKAGSGRILGSIPVMVQGKPARWQEFRLAIGELPDELSFSWTRMPLKWGDVRLISETLWTDDLTHILAGEIRRQLGSKANAYSETMGVVSGDRRIQAAYQHPGFGIDRVELPPIRVGYKKALKIQYGINPAAAMQSDGVDFRIHAWDAAREQRMTILDDSLKPKERPEDRVWQVRQIDLSLYSRHVTQFTFEVSPGPNGDTSSDHALWLGACLVDQD